MHGRDEGLPPRPPVAALLRRPLTPAEAADVAGWSYPPPFDLYDVGVERADLLMPRGADGSGYYAAVDDAARVVAFVVVGAEARVHGQEPVDGVLDVGMGVRPDLTDRGLATALLPQVLGLARELGRPRRLRTAVAAFNQRSLALCRRAGLVVERELTGPGGRIFVELVRHLDR